jgi:uncharacterized protein (UPF0218 family)
MSVDLKRLFLGAKITVLNRRNRLGIYTIEALKCLKSWLQIAVFIDDDDDNIVIDKDGEEDM